MFAKSSKVGAWSAWRRRMVLVTVGAVAFAVAFVVQRRFRGAGAEADPGPLAVVARPAFVYEDDPGPKAGAVSGVVRDSRGTPLAGATVTLARAGYLDAPGRYRNPLVENARSDAAGRFEFKAARAGEYSLAAVAGELGSAGAGPVLLAPGQSAAVDLKLIADGVTLRGRVLGLDGRPVADASLFLASIAAPEGRSAPRVFAVTAAADGSYAVSLARDVYSLVVVAEGRAEVEEQFAVGEALEHDVILEPAARIAGRVVDRVSGQPVAGADVTLSAVGGGTRTRQTSTDARGEFSIAGLAAGSYQCVARKDGLVGVTAAASVTSGDALLELKVPLEPGRVLTGRVVGPHGAPLGGARLVAYRTEAPFERPPTTTSAPDGTFELRGLTASKHRIKVDHVSVAPLEQSADLGAGNVTGLELRPSEPAVVAGVLRDDAGKPVVGAMVRAEVRDRDARARVSRPLPVRTDERGGFELRQLPPGEVVLTAQAHLPWQAASIARRGPERVRPGERKFWKLELARGAAVSGQVKFPDGTPARGATVYALAVGLPASSTVTGSDGSFVIAGLPEGSVSVGAVRRSPRALMFDTTPGPALRSVQLHDGHRKKGVDLVIARGGRSLSGLVVNALATPVAQVSVSARPQDLTGVAGSGAPRVFSGADGRFRIDDVDDVPQLISLQHPSYGDSRLAVQPGSDDLRVTLQAAARLSGHVVDPAGRPVESFALAVWSRSDRVDAEPARIAGIPEVFRNSRAEFELVGLNAGEYQLRAATADGLAANLLVSLRPGDNQDQLKIVLDGGMTVSGRVAEYETNAAIAGGEVRLVGQGQVFEGKTNAEGRFEFRGVTPGQELKIQVAGKEGEHVPDQRTFALAAAAGTSHDVGTLSLVRGNIRDAALKSGPKAVGMALASKDNRVVVSNVTAGSAAAKAGLAAGEAILAVAGTQVRDLGVFGVSYLMAKADGSKVSLRVQGNSPETPVRELEIERRR